MNHRCAHGVGERHDLVGRSAVGVRQLLPRQRRVARTTAHEQVAKPNDVEGRASVLRSAKKIDNGANAIGDRIECGDRELEAALGAEARHLFLRGEVDVDETGRIGCLQPGRQALAPSELVGALPAPIRKVGEDLARFTRVRRQVGTRLLQ